MDIDNYHTIVSRLRQQATADLFRVSVHAHQEMVEENILLSEVEPPKWATPFKRGG